MEKTKGTVLIVDDNTLNSDLLVATLEPIVDKIYNYNSPIKALDESANTDIDIVMIDIVMPELDGFTFAEKFIQLHPNTHVIFVSGHNTKENRLKSFSLGSCVYIEKPFDVNSVRAQVLSVLKLKKLQDQLLREKEKLDCIFEYSSNEIILTDLNFEIISQNNKIISSQPNNKNFVEILKQHNQKDAVNLLISFSAMDDKQISFRVLIDNKKHTKTTVSKILADGKTSGYLIIMDDRTEEVKIEEQRDQFIETLTHDLKTPVRAEKRALELLYDGSFGELNQDQKDIIKEILNSSRYMMRMTNNILTKYKIDNGKFKIFKRSYSIKQTLQSCLDGLKYMFESENQTVKIVSNIKNEMFDYDEREIKRVLVNLIVNASEYSRGNTNITITLEEDKHNLKLSVQDEGIGISQEQLKVIFDEEQSFKSRFKKVGSGLGLFITKKIMEAHNGDILVESQQGKGSIFTLLIPIERACSVHAN